MQEGEIRLRTNDEATRSMTPTDRQVGGGKSVWSQVSGGSLWCVRQLLLQP